MAREQSKPTVEDAQARHAARHLRTWRDPDDGMLHGRFALPVHEVDERYTTTEANALGAADVDAASAAIILEQYLGTLA